MDAWNVQLFSLLNAGPHLAGWPQQLAVFAAQGLVFLVPLVLAAGWLWGPPEQRNTLLMAFVAIVLALAVNVVISLACYYPRPFMVPVGHTYLAHTPDSSFPSDHGTVMLTLGLALISRTAMRRIGALVLLAACVTAWARIYLGVHFPLDMLGALLVAALAVLLANSMAAWIDARMRPATERLYRRLFALPIRQDWVRR